MICHCLYYIAYFSFLEGFINVLNCTVTLPSAQCIFVVCNNRNKTSVLVIYQCIWFKVKLTTI